MAATPTGKGYWLVASDGGIFAFGDANFFGSTGNIRLNQPIVGMAATRRQRLLAATPPTVASSPSATRRSSDRSAGIRLNRPIIGMAATPNGRGYWLVSNTGAVYHYGNAPALGDLRSAGVVATDVVGIAPTSPPWPVSFFS